MRIPDPLQFPVQPNAQSAAAFMGTGESIPVLIVNTDANNTIYVGYRNQSKIGDPNTVPLAPGQSVIMDGARTLYVIGPTGTANATIIPGGTSFFQPTSLNTLGGVKVFVQASAPTQPPTIPVNSIWLQTSGGNVISFNTWNGSAWVAQPFNAQGLLAIGTIVANLIAANTITAAQIAANTITAAQIAANTITAAQIAANTITVAQLAAGIIYAGIVDGTTIVGGTFRAKNASGATILTINKSAGTVLLYQDLGSSTQGALIVSAALAGGTDEFSNTFKPGVVLYDTGTGGNFIQLNFGSPPSGTVGDSTNTWKFDQSFTTANTHTIGNTTGASNISDVVNIPANHATLGTHYIIEVPLTGTFEGGKLNIGMLVGVTFTNIMPTTATAFPTGDTFVGTCRFHLQVTAVGASGKANIWTEGTMDDATLGRDATHSVNLDGFVSQIAFDTTVAQNFAMGWQWSSSIAGQTVTGNSTTVTRKGA